MSLREKLESWFHKDVVEVLSEELEGLEAKVESLVAPEMPALAAAVPPPKVDVPLPPAVEDHDNP
jgi:hypothetical protein